jgi:hypothetical protein
LAEGASGMKHLPEAPSAGLKNIYGAIYANRAQIEILKAEKIL